MVEFNSHPATAPIVAEFNQCANAAASRLLESSSTVGIISSHLGRSLVRHREVCRYLTLAVLQARRAGRVILIAEDSAIEPWATRAAITFRVPHVLLRLNEQSKDREIADDRPIVEIRSDKNVNRDQALVSIADRVDCVFVRAGGTIESVLRQRLAMRKDASVRIATHHAMPQKSKTLLYQFMQQGAVGWYCASRTVEDHGTSKTRTSYRAPNANIDWCHTEGEWLIHCTRACDGPWPGESKSLYRDRILLGDANDDGEGNAAGTLQRILRMRRLVGSALTSRNDLPVVCFSECSLAELLRRRCYRQHLHRWDYEPYGIAIRRSAAEQAGMKKVLYGDVSDRNALPLAERYRFQARGKTFDWTTEREWRSARDVELDQFDSSDIRVFVADSNEADRLQSPYPVSVVDELL